MVCEKYSKLITDEALGGLRPKRGADLREHLAQCASCRNEFGHANILAAAMDRGLKELVTGEPSPQFVARLRARISDEAGPARVDWRAWIPVAAGSFILAVLLIAVVIRTHRPENRTPSPLAQAAGGSDAVVSAKTERTATGGGSPLRRSMARAVQPQEPEVLVPPGQLAAVMQLASAMNQGRIDGEQIVVAQQQSEQPLEIEAIHIAPLSIPQLDDANGASEIPGGF
jgi:putative zinc finger protein